MFVFLTFGVLRILEALEAKESPVVEVELVYPLQLGFEVGSSVRILIVIWDLSRDFLL